MLKKSFILMLIPVMAVLAVNLSAQADTLDFPAPQYMLPMYDHYSANLLNVEAMGRGFTTSAETGGPEAAVNNPATLLGDKSVLYMEVDIKPPIKEINKLSDQMYSSPVPFGLLGFSGKLYQGLKGAISYNMPKSILYDDFTMVINQGAGAVTRYPTYYLHQFTTTLAGKTGDFRLGLNLHHQMHSFNDLTVIHTFEKLDRIYYVFRIQPGILYQKGNYSLGGSYMPETSRSMNFKFARYDVILPMQANAGASIEFSNYRASADAGWEQFSKMDSRFNDRLTLKAGLEKRVRDITYRAGVMSIPSVYKGAYKLPVYETDVTGVLLEWAGVDSVGVIRDTYQLCGSIGFTYHFKGGKLSMGLIRDLTGHVPSTQFAMALGVNLETFKGKKFLIFDK